MYKLSQAIVKSMIQLSLQIYSLASRSTSLESLGSPPGIKPVIFQLPTKPRPSRHVPGRSTKERSSTSLPRISRQTEFEEKDNLNGLSSDSSGDVFKNFSGRVPGFRIATWARRIRSVTRALLKMGSPNSTRRGWARTAPSSSVRRRSETTQRHGSEEEVRRHSVGHLCRCCRVSGIHVSRV